MQREKRKDMLKHIRAFSMPQMDIPDQTRRAVFFLSVNALEKLENGHITGAFPPVTDKNINRRMDNINEA